MADMSMNNSMGKQKVGKIVGILFMSRTYAHMAHLKTASFAKHKALNKFYDGIVDLADDLAEAAQGLWGKLDIPYENIDGDVMDPISTITVHLKRVEQLMATCKEEYIANIFQEIQALYRKTLYLMKELS